MDIRTPCDSGRQHAVVTIAWWMMEALWGQFPKSLAKEFPGYTKAPALITEVKDDIKKDHISAGLRRSLDRVEEICNKYFVETDDIQKHEKNWRILWWAGATMWLDACIYTEWAKSPSWRELRGMIAKWMDRQVRLRGDDEGEIGTWDIYVPIMYRIKGLPLSLLAKYR